jgi:hypothetical protein
MLKPLALSGVLIAVFGSASLRAEEFPWCVEADVFTRNCAFTQRDECIAMAKNIASPATGPGRCIANPNYQPPKSTKATAKASTKPSNKPR